MVDERRKVFDKEWNELDEKEKLIDERKESMKSKLTNVENENDNLMKTKYEIERLKLENSDLLVKLNATQKLMDKFYKSNSNKSKRKVNSKPSNTSDIENEKETDNEVEDEEKEEEGEEAEDDEDKSSVNELNLKEKLTRKELISAKNDYLDDDNDDNDMRELIKHAKQKLQLKLYDAKNNAGYSGGGGSGQNKTTHRHNSNSSVSSSSNAANARENLLAISSSSSSSSDSSNVNSENESENKTKVKKKTNEFITYRQISQQHQQLHQHDPSTVNQNTSTDLSKHKLYLKDNLNREKDALHLANEFLNKYKQTVAKRRLMLDSAKEEMKTDEKYQHKSQNAFEKTKLEDKKVMLEKEEIDVKQLLFNIKTSKRLLKQKRTQLNLLEKNVFDSKASKSSFVKESFSSDTSDLSQNEEQHLNHYFKVSRDYVLDILII